MIRRWLLVAALIAPLGGCDDDASAGDGGVVDAAPVVDMAPSIQRLERRGALPRPPAGRLPAELLPPGR